MADDNRMDRVGDIDESRAVVETNDGVFVAGRGVGPTPQIVGSRRTAHYPEGDMSQIVDVLTGEAGGPNTGFTIETGDPTDVRKVRGLNPIDLPWVKVTGRAWHW